MLAKAKDYMHSVHSATFANLQLQSQLKYQSDSEDQNIKRTLEMENLKL